MFGRALLIITVLIALSGVTLVAFAISDTNTSKHVNVNLPVNQSTSNSTSNSIPNQLTGNKVNKVSSSVSSRTIVSSKTSSKKLRSTGHLLSPLTAKLLAKKYIKQVGASPGTPKLTKEDNKRVYIVPVIQNRIKVGEIDIDAKTGKNLGGAGGAPN